MPTLEPGSLIVITGITAYIASHIGLACLRKGFIVRGTVRSLEKAELLRAGYQKLGVDAGPDKLSFVWLDNLSSQEAFEHAFQGADGVVHTALFEPSANWVDDAVASNIALLNAAKAVGTIKRIVLTSSCVAVYSGPPLERVITDKDWNDVAVENYDAATSEEEKAKWVYHAAKTKAEKEAWRWMETEKPDFDLVATLPNLNIGPLIYGEARATANFILKAFKHDDTDLRRLGPQWYIDVRDCGLLHALALIDPTVSNTRFWAAAGPCGPNEILAILRKHFPTADLPDDLEGPMGESSRLKVDSEKARGMLGGKWISLEQSLVDMAKSVGY